MTEQTETPFLDEMAPEPQEQAAPQPETKEQEAERVRDEKGRFVKAEAGDAKPAAIYRDLETMDEETVHAAREKEKREAEAAKKEHTQVSHAALHEERERRKEAQRRYEQLEQRMERILAARTPEPQPEAPVDDPLERLARVEKVVTDTVKQSTEAQEQYRKEQEFVQRYKASAQAFTQDQPDFMDAYRFLIESRDKELSAFVKDPARRMQMMREEERLIVTEAYGNEDNPARALFEIAKARGYAKKSEAPAAPPPKTVEQVNKGLQASKSLGGGGSKAEDIGGFDGLSPREIAELTDDEFDRLWAAEKKRSGRK